MNDRFRRETKLKYFFSNYLLKLESQNFIPKLYIKADWYPEEIESAFEFMISNFLNKIEKEREQRREYIARATNLTSH